MYTQCTGSRAARAVVELSHANFVPLYGGAGLSKGYVQIGSNTHCTHRVSVRFSDTDTSSRVFNREWRSDVNAAKFLGILAGRDRAATVFRPVKFPDRAASAQAFYTADAIAEGAHGVVVNSIPRIRTPEYRTPKSRAGTPESNNRAGGLAPVWATPALRHRAAVSARPFHVRQGPRLRTG